MVYVSEKLSKAKQHGFKWRNSTIHSLGRMCSQRLRVLHPRAFTNRFWYDQLQENKTEKKKVLWAFVAFVSVGLCPVRPVGPICVYWRITIEGRWVHKRQNLEHFYSSIKLMILHTHALPSFFIMGSSEAKMGYDRFFPVYGLLVFFSSLGMTSPIISALKAKDCSAEHGNTLFFCVSLSLKRAFGWCNFFSDSFFGSEILAGTKFASNFYHFESLFKLWMAEEWTALPIYLNFANARWI